MSLLIPALIGLGAAVVAALLGPDKPAESEKPAGAAPTGEKEPEAATGAAAKPPA